MPLLRPIYLKISVLFKDVSMDNRSFWLAANLLDIGSSANWTGSRVGANFPGSSLLILKGLRQVFNNACMRGAATARSIADA